MKPTRDFTLLRNLPRVNHRHPKVKKKKHHTFTNTYRDLNQHDRNTTKLRIVKGLNPGVVDSDWRFDNLCGSHLQSQCELYHVS